MGMVTKCISVRGSLCQGNHVPVVGDIMLPAEALSLPETGLSPLTPAPSAHGWAATVLIKRVGFLDQPKDLLFQDAKVPGLESYLN